MISGLSTSVVSDRTAEDRPPAQPLSLFTVLQQEFEELHGAGGTPDTGAQAGEPGDALEKLYHRIHGLGLPRTALCLSGGGIRSASFALGVLQALARHGLLKQFHYLSTVSGGGYIGGWLSAWRHHERDDDTVFTRLTQRGGYSVAQNDGFAEPAELRELRANSNFLTPKLGLLSADTWTGIALYIPTFCSTGLFLDPCF